MTLPTDIPVTPLIAQSGVDPKRIFELLRNIDFGELLAAAVIVAGAYLINRFVGSTLERIGEGAPKRRLVTKKIATVVRLGIFLLAFHLVVMTFLEGQRELLFGLGGTIAVAAGLALEDSVSSIIAGVLILVDRPFQVGDRIEFGDSYGEVTEIGLRSVRIDTPGGEEVSVPNNRFLTERVTSASGGTLDMMAVVDFDVAITADEELAKRIVYETCATSRYVHLDKPVRTHVREVRTPAGLAVQITCKAYIVDARYEGEYETDVADRVKNAFLEHDIQRPYFREYLLESVGAPDEHRREATPDRKKEE